MPEITANQWIAGVFISTSAICFVRMGWDKLCAIKGWRRIPESQLLFWAFMGGAVGGKLAQRLFHHKTAKQPFAGRLHGWLIVNVLVYGIALTPPLRLSLVRVITALVA